MSSYKTVFNVFLSAVMKEMRKTEHFEWNKLLVAGAHGVAEHLHYEEKVVPKPKVVVTKEEGTHVMTHQFIAETSKFHYVGVAYGRDKHLFKEFSELKKEFWNEKFAMSPHAKSKEDRVNKSQEDEEFEAALKKGQDKYKDAIKNKRKNKKLARQNRRENPKSPTTPEETPVTEEEAEVTEEEEEAADKKEEKAEEKDEE